MARKSRRAITKRLSLRLPVDLTAQLTEKISQLSSRPASEYLKTQLLSKFVSDDTDPPEVRRNRAIFKWLLTERENEATNDRLIITHEEYNILPRVTYQRFVEHCQTLVSEILGETPPVDALIGSFSGGASTSRPRTSSNPAEKYLGKAHVTDRCLDLWNDIVVPECPGWLSDGATVVPTVVPGNVLFTVPKNTEIDRVACKEPDLNMYIQKGIGTHFRECLRRTGINLNDQSINRSLARVGSIDGSLATLDLSSASDSVSTGLVALFLPATWYTLLDSVRSPVTIIDGEIHRNSMFSSMGNGFTFELESLLFLVLARATAYFTGTRGRISVYGDDIICPTGMSQDLMWVLSYFGFQVNPDKSFWTGSFRESCGGHYLNGVDITPFYIRSPITSLTDLIDVANKLRQWGSNSAYGVVDPEIEPIWLWIKSMIPDCLWGGVDTSFKYQLASDDVPRLRISEETKRRDTGLGGYYHWLNTTWDRSTVTDGVATSSLTKGLGLYRLRRAKVNTVTRLPALFYHEIVGADAE